MTTYLAFLRGVNVGGENKLRMQDLVDLFSAAGCKNVRTYIQSGNVIFTADVKLVAKLAARIAEQIQERFGYQTPVILRTAAQLQSILLNPPFKDSAETLHVMLLAQVPNALRVKTLEPHRSPPDEFAVIGQEVYLKLPNGAARTKLTNAYFDSRLATVGTMRNWRTLTKLLEMTPN